MAKWKQVAIEPQKQTGCSLNFCLVLVFELFSSDLFRIMSTRFPIPSILAVKSDDKKSFGPQHFLAGLIVFSQESKPVVL